MDRVKPSLTLNTGITNLFRAELGKFDYYIQLFQKTLSEEKQKVFKPRPQGNVGCFKSVFCWQTITPLNEPKLVADFYSTFILNHTYHFSF